MENYINITPEDIEEANKIPDFKQLATKASYRLGFFRGSEFAISKANEQITPVLENTIEILQTLLDENMRSHAADEIIFRLITEIKALKSKENE